MQLFSPSISKLLKWRRRYVLPTGSRNTCPGGPDIPVTPGKPSLPGSPFSPGTPGGPGGPVYPLGPVRPVIVLINVLSVIGSSVEKFWNNRFLIFFFFYWIIIPNLRDNYVEIHRSTAVCLDFVWFEFITPNVSFRVISAFIAGI